MLQKGRPRAFDRESALRTAMETFWEHGYEGTSIAELISAMDIRPPSLYAAFGSKEALFREAVACYSATEGAAAFAALDRAGSALAAVEAMLRANVIAYTDPAKPAGCMVVLAATTYTPSTAGVRDFLTEKRRATTARVRDRLAGGVAEGDLPPGADVDALAAYVMAVQFGLSQQARDGADRATLSGVVDRAMLALAGEARPRE